MKNWWLFQFTFFDAISMGKKLSWYWCTFFDLILITEKSILFQHIFHNLLWKINIVSTYFFQHNFLVQEVDVILVYFFRSNFNVWKFYIVLIYFFMHFWWKTNATLTCLFWCIFERQQIVIVLISFLKLFDISNRNVFWTFLLNVV